MATPTTGPQYMTSLPTINTTELPESLYDQECAICLTAFEEGIQDAVQLPCRHAFNRVCLAAWLSEKSGKNTCPTCRHVLFEKPDDTVVLNIYNGIHERIEFSRRLSDPIPTHFWREAFSELTSLGWFCLGGPLCDDDSHSEHEE